MMDKFRQNFGLQISRANREFALHDVRVAWGFKGCSWPFDKILRIIQDLHLQDLLKSRITMMVYVPGSLCLVGD